MKWLWPEYNEISIPFHWLFVALTFLSIFWSTYIFRKKLQ